MQLFKNIWTPRSIVIIFLHFNGSEQKLAALKYTAKEGAKGEVGKAQLFDTLEEIVKNYGKSVPYHLHVSGSGVLSRKLESLPNYMDELVINGNSDDFVFSTYDDETSLAASFFRRQLIEEHLEYMQEQKIHLLGISSGLTPLFTLEDSVNFNFDYSLVKENGKISNFQRLENGQEKVLIDGVYFTAQQLLAKSIFQNLREPDTHYISSVEETYTESKNNYKQFNQFRVSGLTLLSVIFLSLVINYFYQNNLNNQVAQLEQDLSMSNDNLALLDRLEQEKIRKEQLVFSTGVNSSRFLSYYLDEIGRTVPEKVNLRELEVFPLDGKMKNKRKVEVDESSIRISGSTQGNEMLDDWIERMDRFEWVQSVELLNYLKTEGDRADFILTITLG